MAAATRVLPAEGRVRSMRTIPEVVEDIKSILNNIERTENCDGETLVDINEFADEILTINTYKPNKQNNAYRIRSMSDEELTKIIMCPYDTAGKPIEIMPCVRDGNVQELVPPEDCKKCMMEWLQSEAEE